MAEDGESVCVVRVAGRQDLDLIAVRERQAQVARLPVRAHQHRLLGELRTDCPRSVEAARPVGQLELGPIGQDDLHRGGG